jgi:hypothetical protein
MLMPSTPSAYPQVDGGHFASFRVLRFSVSAVHAVLCAWFDSRQLHTEAGQSRKLWPVFCKPRFVFDSVSTGLGISAPETYFQSSADKRTMVSADFSTNFHS